MKMSQAAAVASATVRLMMRLISISRIFLATLTFTLTTRSGTGQVHAVVLTDEGKCRVMGFFPTTTLPRASTDSSDAEVAPSPPYERWPQHELERVSASYTAAAFMAVKDFNERNASLVAEIANISQDCTVQLQLDIITDHVDAKIGGKLILEEGPQLCAFLGTYDPGVARAMQPMSASLDLPQVIYATLDQFLTSSKRPSAVGLPPTVLPHARALAEYLNADQVDGFPPREHMAMVYEEAYTSSYFAQCFQEDAADKYGLHSQKYQDDHLGIVPTKTPAEFQRGVLETVRDSGVKTIFLNKLDSTSLHLTSQLLDEYDMLTDEYIYIFTPQAVPSDAVGHIFGPQPRDSPMDKLLRGGLIFDHLDPFKVHPEEDPFFIHWKSQDTVTFVKELALHLALELDTPFPYFCAAGKEAQRHRHDRRLHVFPNKSSGGLLFLPV